MTEAEKLAQSWSSQTDQDHNDCGCNVPIRAYIAGFRKAREMARDQFVPGRAFDNPFLNMLARKLCEEVGESEVEAMNPG